MSQPIQSVATLQRLLELTESMIQAAQSELWDAVSDLNKQRMRLLDASDDVMDSDKNSQQRLSRLILLADARLLADSTASRDKMANAGIEQRSRSTAVRGYRDAQALRCSVAD